MPDTAPTTVQEHALLWAEALESGDYEQGHNALRGVPYIKKKGSKSYQFCCLGVACDTYRKSTGMGEWTGVCRFYDGTDGGYDEDAHHRSGVMPDAVVKWLGFNRGNPTMDFSAYVPDIYKKEEGLNMTLANDRVELDFATIAKVVRTHFGLPPLTPDS